MYRFQWINKIVKKLKRTYIKFLIYYFILIKNVTTPTVLQLYSAELFKL